MPSFQGQTGKVLKIQLQSALIAMRWGLNAVAMGGRIPIEVETQFVADGSKIKITVKDSSGTVIEALEGKTYSNFHRSIFALTKENNSGGMFFEVELAAHGLKGVGPKLNVLPPIKISELKWLDDKGKAATEVVEGQVVDLAAQIKGPKDGTESHITIKCRKSETGKVVAGVFPVKVKDGKLSLKWKVKMPGSAAEIAVQAELDKDGTKYFQPAFFFEVSCNGVIAESGDIQLQAFIQFDFSGQKGKAVLRMPDGTEETKEVPADGILRIEKSKVGNITVVDFLAESKDKNYAKAEESSNPEAEGESEDEAEQSESSPAQGT